MSQERMTIEEYKQFQANPVRTANNLKRGDGRKANMGWTLIDLSRRLGLTLVKEYRFHAKRKWRADWAMFGTRNGKEIKIIVEYEGLGFGKTGHTHSAGYSKDAEKYNSAQALGWIVLRYTHLTYENLTTDLENILHNKL